MYEQISGNIWKTRFLIFAFLVLIMAIGYAFYLYYGEPFTLIIAAVLAIGGSFTSYYYSDQIVLSISGARPASKQDFPHLVNSVEGLAMAAGLPAPRCYTIDDSAPNAFATGRDPEHAVICVTTGLLDKMNRVELEGVIAHEMSHIKNYDIRLMTIISVLVGTVVLLSDWFGRSMWYGGHRRRRSSDRDGGTHPIIMIIALLLIILAPIFAALMQAALSRRREYLADASGAMLTRFPDGLASALEKIAADPEPLEAANKATAHLYIANPLKDIGGRVNNLFDTHPPIEKRVERLRAL